MAPGTELKRSHSAQRLMHHHRPASAPIQAHYRHHEGAGAFSPMYMQPLEPIAF